MPPQMTDAGVHWWCVENSGDLKDNSGDQEAGGIDGKYV